MTNLGLYSARMDLFDNLTLGKSIFCAPIKQISVFTGAFWRTLFRAPQNTFTISTFSRYELDGVAEVGSKHIYNFYFQ